MKSRFRLDDGQIEVVDDAVAEILRSKTPAERMFIVAKAWKTARKWVKSAVSSQHPEWNSQVVGDEVNRRMLGGTA